MSKHNNNLTSPQLALSPFLPALENQIENEDDDDGENDDNSSAKAKDIFYLLRKVEIR